MMRAVGDRADGQRLRALIVLLWRAGLRVSEALALRERSRRDSWRDARPPRQGRQATRGRDGPVGLAPARAVAADAWAVADRSAAVRDPRTDRGQHWEASAARKQFHHAAAAAGVRRRFAPHQLRHAHAVEMAHEGVPLVVIQRQLGHANLGITSIYLQGIDSAEIIDTVH